MSPGVIPLLLLLAAGLAAESTPLAIIENDTIWYVGGASDQGDIVEIRSDGTVLLKKKSQDRPIPIPKVTIQRIEHHRTAADVVRLRGKEGLAENKLHDVLRTARWGVEKNAKDAVLELVRTALATAPGETELAQIAIAILNEKNDLPAVEVVALATLKVNPQWEAGYDALASAYKAQGKDAELLDLAKRWLERSSTALRPNLLLGATAEAAGELATARSSWAKGWTFGKSPEAGLGLVRTSLALGRIQEAATVAEELVAANLGGGEALVWAGAAALSLGDLATAEQRFKAVTGALPPAAATALQHDRAVLDWRLGRRDAAIAAWSASTDPVSQFALALVRRDQPGDPSRLPPALRPAARELAAAWQLEHPKGEVVLAGLEPATNARHATLALYAAVLKRAGAEDAVRALERIRTPESKRWQLHGHLIGGRLAQAQAIADEMPADDGWTASVRVYLAAARKDEAGAMELLARANDSRDPPRDYLVKLNAVYGSADDEVIVESFDGADNELLPTGWTVEAAATGIRVHRSDGRLHFAGTQTGAESTRAVRRISPRGLKQVKVILDPAGLAGAECGVEILDGDGRAGAAVACGNDGRLRWRARSDKSRSEWGAWSQTAFQAQTGIVIDISGGELVLVDGGDPSRRQPLAPSPKPVGEWTVAVYGSAAEGTTWKLDVDEVTMALWGKPKKK